MHAARTFACLAVCGAVAACGAIPPPSVGERVEYWNSALSANLPPGTPRAAVEKYFSDRGLRYRSGVRTEAGPAGCEYSEVHAVEDQVVRGFMTSGWDIDIYVCLDPAE